MVDIYQYHAGLLYWYWDNHNPSYDWTWWEKLYGSAEQTKAAILLTAVDLPPKVVVIYFSISDVYDSLKTDSL